MRVFFVLSPIAEPGSRTDKVLLEIERGLQPVVCLRVALPDYKPEDMRKVISTWQNDNWVEDKDVVVFVGREVEDYFKNAVLVVTGLVTLKRWTGVMLTKQKSDLYIRRSIEQIKKAYNGSNKV